MTVIEKKVHFGRGKRSEKVLRQGPGPVRGWVPWISKLMELAITFEELMRSGAARTFAELAELGQISSARITQIINLLLLAPEIQERLLFFAGCRAGARSGAVAGFAGGGAGGEVGRAAGRTSNITRWLVVQIPLAQLDPGTANSRGHG